MCVSNEKRSKIKFFKFIIKTDIIIIIKTNIIIKTFYYYMKILSIDVGIKNLAFCLFEKTEGTTQFKITKWDTINLSEQETLKCNFIDKDKDVYCNNTAKFKKDDKCFCLKHSKKQIYPIPTQEQKPSFINKQKIQKLHEIANGYNIKYENKIKKLDLANLINEHIANTYFIPIETTNASEINLFEVGKNIKHHFNKLFSNETSINHVIIENQIGPIATRMKTIQGMIVQYFVMSPLIVEHIEFISAANKLKCCNMKDLKGESSDKVKYSERKKKGIEKCLEIITNDFRFKEHVNYFNSHKKKDDLSDSFLQGLWFVNDRKM